MAKQFGPPSQRPTRSRHGGLRFLGLNMVWPPLFRDARLIIPRQGEARQPLVITRSCPRSNTATSSSCLTHVMASFSWRLSCMQPLDMQNAPTPHAVVPLLLPLRAAIVRNAFLWSHNLPSLQSGRLLWGWAQVQWKEGSCFFFWKGYKGMAQVGALSNADSIDCEGYDPTNSLHEWVRVPIDHHHWHSRYHYK